MAGEFCHFGCWQDRFGSILARTGPIWVDFDDGEDRPGSKFGREGSKFEVRDQILVRGSDFWSGEVKIWSGKSKFGREGSKFGREGRNLVGESKISMIESQNFKI